MLEDKSVNWYHEYWDLFLNKNKTIKNIGISLLSLLILTYSTVLQFSMSSVVLCFGDDGHIAFEQSDVNHQCDDIEDDITRPVNNFSELSLLNVR